MRAEKVRGWESSLSARAPRGAPGRQDRPTVAWSSDRSGPELFGPRTAEFGDVADEIERRRFDGDRFAIEAQVESVESGRRAGSKLRPIFEEGVTIVTTDRFDAVRRRVFEDE